jgi:hypothetical protein
MEIYYSGTDADIKKQKECKHCWHGPFADCKGSYYRCNECLCIKRIDVKEAREISKKENLHNVCGAFVHSVNLDYDWQDGRGVVTLFFEKPRQYHLGDPLDHPEPKHTEISFPFETLTVRRRD